ncbi:integrase core domain-containing protein [Aquirufa ecclesiirivi]|uniref:integrase core domain-containing protein n=1 Tax=Aquirufa ecclesiirivi TaxID=2715124 RepID=UPI003B8A6B5D
MESFNRYFRDKCLFRKKFLSLENAKDIYIEMMWDYNYLRPHNSLINLTPQHLLISIKIIQNPYLKL